MWALGVLTYEMIACSTPFYNPNCAIMLHAILSTKVIIIYI